MTEEWLYHYPKLIRHRQYHYMIIIITYIFAMIISIYNVTCRCKFIDTISLPFTIVNVVKFYIVSHHPVKYKRIIITTHYTTLSQLTTTHSTLVFLISPSIYNINWENIVNIDSDNLSYQSYGIYIVFNEQRHYYFLIHQSYHQQ